MQLPKLLASLLIGSVISLTLGGFLLYYYALVPIVLILTTFIAVLVLLLLSTYVVRGNVIAINIATILGVLAPIMSYFTPSHVGVLEQIGTGGLIRLLGVLQFLGFYAFPIIYVVLRLVFYQKIGHKPIPVDSKVRSP